MENLRLSTGNHEAEITEKQAEATVILPVMHRRTRQGMLFKRLFFVFLLGFFALCVCVLWSHAFADKEALAEAAATLLIERGISLPK